MSHRIYLYVYICTNNLQMRQLTPVPCANCLMSGKKKINSRSCLFRSFNESQRSITGWSFEDSFDIANNGPSLARCVSAKASLIYRINGVIPSYPHPPRLSSRSGRFRIKLIARQHRSQLKRIALTQLLLQLIVSLIRLADKIDPFQSIVISYRFLSSSLRGIELKISLIGPLVCVDRVECEREENLVIIYKMNLEKYSFRVKISFLC